MNCAESAICLFISICFTRVEFSSITCEKLLYLCLITLFCCVKPFLNWLGHATHSRNGVVRFRMITNMWMSKEKKMFAKEENQICELANVYQLFHDTITLIWSKTRIYWLRLFISLLFDIKIWSYLISDFLCQY